MGPGSIEKFVVSYDRLSSSVDFHMRDYLSDRSKVAGKLYVLLQTEVIVDSL